MSNEQHEAQPAGWRIESGVGGFGEKGDRWICVRNLQTQCGQDFYEDRDPLMFAFLSSMPAPGTQAVAPDADDSEPLMLAKELLHLAEGERDRRLKHHYDVSEQLSCMPIIARKLVAALAQPPAPSGMDWTDAKPCAEAAGSERIWDCKIGGPIEGLPQGADAPMRAAIVRAYEQLTGFEPLFCFSGWGGQLTELEREVVERQPTAALSAQPADKEAKR